MKANTIHLSVIEVQYPLEGVASIRLKPVGQDIMSYRAGQFITLIFDHLGTKEIRRSYSLSSTYGIDPYLEITVRQLPNGVVSGYLCQDLKPGDELLALKPSGNFILPEDSEKENYLLLAAGSGITPVFSLLKKILTSYENSHVHLLYANSDENRIIFREEIMYWLGQYPDRFTCLHLLSNYNGEVDLTKGGELPSKVRMGRLSNLFLEDHLHAIWKYPPQQTHIYLCGPAGFMLKASNTLRFMEFPERRIHQEIFDIVSPFRPDTDQLIDCEISVQSPTGRHQFLLKAGESILEAALRNSIHLPYSCNSGTCTTCSVDCLSGKVKMYTIGGPTDSDATRGTVFTCVGYPETDKLILQLQ